MKACTLVEEDFSNLEGEIITKIETALTESEWHTFLNTDGKREEYCVTKMTEFYSGVTINALYFYTASGKIFVLTHDRECCEFVELIDIVGDLNSLIGTKIISATVESSDDVPELSSDIEIFRDTAELWTFYIIQGEKDSVTLRWFGSSNGYYSIEVECYLAKPWNPEDKKNV